MRKLVYYVPTAVHRDADVQAFVTAAGLTNASQAEAIKNLVRALKEGGIWESMTALYPMVGGTARAHTLNLRDVTAYPLYFSSRASHSRLGMELLENGYAATGLAVTDVSNSHLSYYLHNPTTTANDVVIGSYGNEVEYYIQSHNAKAESVYATGLGYAVSNAVPRGLLLGSSTNSGAGGRLYWNATLVAVQPAYSKAAAPIYIGALNNGGTATNGTTATCSLASIGTYLTAEQVSAFYAAVQDYQAALGRAV